MMLVPSRPGGMEYAQVIRVSPTAYPPDWENVAQIIAANPEALWIIGNEPDCISQDNRTPTQYATISQDNRTPTQYATIYHDCYVFIKEHDPTAQVAIGGVVVPTPLRREWLAHVLAAYQTAYGEPMPIDVWNIHVQILQEKRGSWGCGIPPQGEQGKPLIISEFGVLMPSEYLGHGDRAAGDIVVMDFMSMVFDFLRLASDESTGYPEDEAHLVQRWLWYSLNEPYYDFETQTGMNGALFEASDPTQLTVLGQHWKRYMDAIIDRGYQLYIPLHFPAFTQEQP